MASLKDLLQKTMLFKAADGVGIDAYSRKLGPGAPVAFAPPTWSESTKSADRAIWHWVHNPGMPAQITGLTALQKMTMGGATMTAPMSVATRVEALQVKLVVDPGSDPVDLPLTPAYVVAKFFLDKGQVKSPDTIRNETNSPVNGGWFLLDSNVDASILVVFAYELVPADGAAPKPISIDKIENLGSKFFPKPDVQNGDPDSGVLNSLIGVPPGMIQVQQSQTVYTGPVWVVVAFGFTTCKQKADFEPGGVLGAGRIYPHVMVTCNQPLVRVETRIAVERPPASTMPSDPDMQSAIGGILVEDTNGNHASIPGPPLPLWSNFFDYYDLSPPPGIEFTVVDPARSTTRDVTGAIQRERSSMGGLGTRTNIYEPVTTFKKLPGQGDYDNLHLAPKMKFTDPSVGVTIPNIAMAPFCVHDCFHTHFRWGTLGGSMPVQALGFDGRMPYAKAGAPLVPDNQTVFLKLTSPNSFEYRAVQQAPIHPASWSVFYHHGSAYALALEGTHTIQLARFGVAAAVIQQCEPLTRANESILPVLDRDILSVNPTQSWAAFYQRLQFTGTAAPDVWMPRLNILDLAKCRTS
jgi:hypothetical protein